ncbi:MAG: glycine--tRNA ligase subunit beta, partial [Proteobacteria bacterium]|nr:glycine--tRNA ligase subunit beta [Pseudomonadota bacterium]
MADILFELGCEELPPKTLYKLSKSLFESVCDQLKKHDFKFDDSSRWFASPRRLAFILNNINESQQDKTIEKRGPAIKVAFDTDGNATPAALGFARSVNADVSELKRIKTDQGEWIGFEVLEKGQNIASLLPHVIQTAIKQLPIAKPMRWGSNDYAFIRPVHWLLLLKDKEIIPMSMFGKHSSNLSKGHRFHHPAYIQIESAGSYVTDLQGVKIIVDQNIREQIIKTSVQQAVKAVDGIA